MSCIPKFFHSTSTSSHPGKIKAVIKVSAFNPRIAYVFEGPRKVGYIRGLKGRLDAINGDLVMYQFAQENTTLIEGLRECSVVSVLRRTVKSTLVSTRQGSNIAVSRNGSFPTMRIMGPNIRDLAELREPGLAVARILGSSSSGPMRACVIEEVLGVEGTPAAELPACLDFFDLRRARAAYTKGQVSRLAKRTSCSLTSTERTPYFDAFTIDPPEAKDLDDAISVGPAQVLTSGKHKGQTARVVSVHVADVSFYVRPDDPVDQEASERCTTVYMPHKVYHMLPRRLSEDMCSLTPGSRKRTKTVSFTLLRDGTIVGEPTFESSLIVSKARLAYDEVDSALSDPKERSRFVSKFGKELMADVEYLARACKALSESRLKNSPLGKAIHQQDVLKFILNKTTDEPVAVSFPEDPSPAEAKSTVGGPAAVSSSSSARSKIQFATSHSTIEELMVLANKFVAERISEFATKGIETSNERNGSVLKPGHAADRSATDDQPDRLDRSAIPSRSPSNPTLVRNPAIARVHGDSSSGVAEFVESVLRTALASSAKPMSVDEQQAFLDETKQKLQERGLEMLLADLEAGGIVSINSLNLIRQKLSVQIKAAEYVAYEPDQRWPASSEEVAESNSGDPKSNGGDPKSSGGDPNREMKAVHSAETSAFEPTASTSPATRHWALGLDKYMHFTSPIRRYADILAHRLLHATLSSRFGPRGTASPVVSLTDLEAAAEKCSRVSRLADDAQRQGIEFLLSYYIRSLGEAGLSVQAVIESIYVPENLEEGASLFDNAVGDSTVGEGRKPEKANVPEISSEQTAHTSGDLSEDEDSSDTGTEDSSIDLESDADQLESDAEQHKSEADQLKSSSTRASKFKPHAVFHIPRFGMSRSHSLASMGFSRIVALTRHRIAEPKQKGASAIDTDTPSGVNIRPAVSTSVVSSIHLEALDGSILCLKPHESVSMKAMVVRPDVAVPRFVLRTPKWTFPLEQEAQVRNRPVSGVAVEGTT